MTNADILQHFEKRDDGSWVCVAAAVIETSSGPLAIEPGQHFTFGESHAGLDVAEFLEQLGAQFGS
jgi:hypothetical protein